MNLYLLDEMAKDKMREAEKRAREARLKALLRERVRAGERPRLGVQLGRLAMICTWLVEGVLPRRWKPGRLLLLAGGGNG